jgi:hypothetical protein
MDENWLRMLEERVLSTTFWSKRSKVKILEKTVQLGGLIFVKNITIVIKYRRKRWAGCVACMGRRKSHVMVWKVYKVEDKRRTSTDMGRR